MNKNLKIKYIIGSFRDKPDFPLLEDLVFMMSEWFYHENGKEHMIKYRNIDTEFVCFPDYVLFEKVGNEQLAKEKLEEFINKNQISLYQQKTITKYYNFV